MLLITAHLGTTKGSKVIYKLKTLGLALVAVLAMSAVVASAASAQFTASSYPTTVTAISELGNDDLKTEGGSVECEAHFQGTLTEASATMTITATNDRCKAFGFSEATVSMNGCDYVFHSNGMVDLECSGTNKIVITAGSCEVQIGTQTGLSKVDLANGAGDITAKATVAGIAYTVTKDGFLCPFTTGGVLPSAKTGATYTQNEAITVKSTGSSTVSVD